ncbi:hypothetical protein CSUI_005160 [Cystoisospora suis]|uniref:Uncharacterized protein n=1 Tax=Cystoisospora suis TaxID=483139 RepID=A0A2C6KYJ1_9APIC|nr:hypothetical protein CSUI_005160 [Cystoisospora suis]
MVKEKKVTRYPQTHRDFQNSSLILYLCLLKYMLIYIYFISRMDTYV